MLVRLLATLSEERQVPPYFKRKGNDTSWIFGWVQVSSEGSIPANDGKSNRRYVSCSKPSLHHHKAPLGASAI